MRILIVSDLHGSKNAAELIYKLDQINHFKSIWLLGDIGYSGARNVPPVDYYPIDVYKYLNLVKDKLVVIRGNCDSRVDEFVLGRKFNDLLELDENNHHFYLTHGDLYQPENFNLKPGDVYLQGHTHIYQLIEKNGVYFINPGSIALPKQSLIKTYLIYDLDYDRIDLLDFDGNIIESINLSKQL